MKSKNPYGICTWNEESDCKNCENSNALACRWSLRTLMGFLLPALGFCLTAIFGLVLVGLMTRSWWPLIALGGFWIFFFVFFEIRILCSHCPYYARRGATLHCLANHGIIKLWRYNPEPMNGFEKTALVICFLIFGLFPLGVEVYGVWFAASKLMMSGPWMLLAISGVGGATFLMLVAFFSVLQVFICPKCINFSCPFNRVPKKRVDAYLRRNPVMKDAWEKSGYKLG